MKKLKLKSVYLLLIILVASCAQKSEKQRGDGIGALIPTDQILKIEIDDETPNLGTCLFQHDEQNEYLYFLNNNLNEIQKYNLSTGKIEHKFRLEREGDKGVGQVNGFYVQSLDSIFIFSRYKKEFYIVSDSGKIQGKIKYELPDGYSNAVVLSKFYTKPFIKNNSIFLKTKIDGNWNFLTSENLSNKHLFFKVNLSSQKAELLPYTYPSNYFDGGKKEFSFSVDYTGEKFVYSFYADHNLYLSDKKDFTDLTIKKRKSKYFKNDFGAFPNNPDMKEYLRYLVGFQKYESLIYDKYRKVYYRFCYPNVELETTDDLNFLMRYPKTFSIMLLDEDLNIITEKLFENNDTYVPNNAFVSRDGLYLSINHPSNPLNEENAFSFKLIKTNL